mmetsp:Transcript_23559/g.33051  ORF Transcript_23559/g.33051 Transcript_23559/m.33051 type:complete len:114 (+) Transcript_23559:555-896(+)
MEFMLPQDLTDLSKIPIPTNPSVKVVDLSPVVGAVHQNSGNLDRTTAKEKAVNLIQQLKRFRLSDIDYSSTVLEKFQYWRYNPPMSLPFLSRNEVWIELTQEQVDMIMRTFKN